MNAESITIESEEDGFWMVVQLDQEIPLVTDEGRMRFKIHGIAPQLLQEVQRTIGEWWAEGQAVARAEYDREVYNLERQMGQHAPFECVPEDIDESGGVAEIGFIRPAPNPDNKFELFHETFENGYDISDPKHPDFHSTHVDLWDARAGK